MTILPSANSKLFQRATLIAFALVVLLTSIILTIVLGNFYRHTERSVGVAMHDITLVIKTRVDGTLRRIHGDLDQLASMIPEAALDRHVSSKYVARMNQELNRHLTHFPEVSSYRVYDENGANLYSSASGDPEHHIADRDYFQAAKADPSLSLTYSQSIIGKISQKPIVVIAKPLRDQSGRFRGVVMGVVDLAYFVQILSNIDLGPQGVLSLRRTEDGALVARWPETNDDLNVPLPPGNLIRGWLESNKPSGTMKVIAASDDIERLYGFWRVDGYPFAVFAGRATQNYLSEWRQIALVTVGIAALALGLLATFLWRLQAAFQQERNLTLQLSLAKETVESTNRALSQLNASLETRVAERTVELATAKDAAEAAYLAKSKASLELKAFAKEQNRLIEQERRTIAREVHDQIGQVFTAIKIIIDFLPPDALPQEQSKALKQALTMGITATRRVTAELRPPLLDDLGFAAAVSHYVAEHPGLVSMQSTVRISESEALDADQTLTLFRIIQESVTNVVRHAKASSLDITGLVDESYILTIRDNGCGLDATSPRVGALGLVGMRERASLLGGECLVRSLPGEGTIVEVRLPLSENLI